MSHYTHRTACIETSYIDDIVDSPDHRDQVEYHQGARVIVLGYLHLGQANTLSCALEGFKPNTQVEYCQQIVYNDYLLYLPDVLLQQGMDNDPDQCIEDNVEGVQDTMLIDSLREGLGVHTEAAGV